MSWVYPQSINNNLEWQDYPSGVGIIPALEIGDTEYAYVDLTNPLANELDLQMGTMCAGGCELRAKGDSDYIYIGATLRLSFYNGASLVHTETIPSLTPSWQTYTIGFSGPWNRVVMVGAALQGYVAVAYLRGQEFFNIAIAPSRLLSGVGR
ncbi:MAG: hypothetical protein NZ556_07840 [Fimbriimonadales bacterium]|nr:hypothetical protein [Fimbriimonadales bacterium]